MAGLPTAQGYAMGKVTYGFYSRWYWGVVLLAVIIILLGIGY